MRNRIRPGGPFLVRSLLDAQAVFAIPAAEYQFGTHQLAIHQSQCFSFVWKAAAAAVAATNIAFPPLVTNARAPQDQTQLQGQIFSSTIGATPRLIPRVSNANAPQSLDLTLQGWIRGTPSPRQGAVPPLTQSAPQLLDATQQGKLFAPIPMAQGVVPALLKGAQADPTQIPAQVFRPAATPPVVTGQIARFFIVPPQNEDRPTSIIWNSQRSGQTSPVFRLTQGSPQLLDLTLQGRIFAPAIGRSLPFKALYAAPQLLNFTQQGVIFQASKPAAIITGTTVKPLPPIPPQLDLNFNASMIWVQGPLSVAGVVTEIHRLNRRYRGYDKGASKWDRGRR